MGEGFSPNWSSGGRQIVFERIGSKVVIADAGGSGERVVAGVPEAQFVFFSAMAPALSPDGRRIAFFR